MSIIFYDHLTPRDKIIVIIKESKAPETKRVRLFN